MRRNQNIPDLCVNKHFFSVYMVSEDEWTVMKSNFIIDKEISVMRNKDDKYGCFSTEPTICGECMELRIKEEEEVMQETKK